MRLSALKNLSNVALRPMSVRCCSVLLIFSAVVVVTFTCQPLRAVQALQESRQQKEINSVQKAELGQTRNAFRIDNLFLSGQFAPDDLGIIKRAGIDRIISLRTEGEIEWDEKGLVEAAGIEFQSLPVAGVDSLTDEFLDQTCLILKDAEGRTLIHCGIVGRAAAVWIAHRVLNEGVSIAQAEQEAATMMPQLGSLKTRVLEYVEKRQSASPKAQDPVQRPTSVKPGINDSFLDPNLDPQQYVERFEVESREVYESRHQVLRALRIRPGMRIADIGAGTGLYTRLFANETGPTGWVFAVDIAPPMIQHIAQRAATDNQRNITGVICQEDSVCLPPESIDLAFVCDTYHHFEFPQATLQSIHSALKPGGRLAVIDFIRIEGKSRPWTLDHVRAGQEVFTAEILEAGFQKISEVEIAGFEENYFLIFEKQ